MNSSQYNEDQFNQDHDYASQNTYQVAFNGFDLMSHCGTISGIAIQSASFHNMISEVTSVNSSLSDGGLVIDKRYPIKTIPMLLFIQGTSYDDLISKIDELKARTQGIEGNFDVMISGKVRRYEATVQTITVPTFKRSQDYVDGIEMELVITSPHWKLRDPSQVYVQNQTANFSKVVNNDGNYETFPVVSLITNAGSTLSQISLEIKKVGDPSGYTIALNETIAPSSVVIFDFIEKIVTVNGVEKNFSGVMMPIATGQNVFGFSFSGTVNVNTYILHYPTFL